MVLDAAFVASTVTSVMMNGVCCVWQMQEEEDRRDAIRKDIRVEYERQRLIEREMWEQRQSFYANSQAGSDSSLGSRRQKLIVEKMNLSANSARQGEDEEQRDGASPKECHQQPYGQHKIQDTSQRLQMRVPVPPKPFSKNSFSVECERRALQRKSALVKGVAGEPATAVSVGKKSLLYPYGVDSHQTMGNPQASLMDDDDDDDHDDDIPHTESDDVTSLVDVALQ
mmetsp:Transcript_6687/g.13981  ORF Transcript_6687/g.13981 Transcript_6687/m.13981 type:complete len:226 (-) Transcript_6687:214-891(-)|eukprot:CAMPEP_0172462592 /NCGR_PEP_ID=MMETSP1065-20121228/44248_1 /TAXON_ID=265537 /ORGANISM="Amphiprora paludosa, Strain CCMP125" /LENGTH=225 /DNA_ID=CAMNT_0013218289 /DNA_START=237 /DNA_END=914 /DNA_ORIENTATION=+